MARRKSTVAYSSCNHQVQLKSFQVHSNERFRVHFSIISENRFSQVAEKDTCKFVIVISKLTNSEKLYHSTSLTLNLIIIKPTGFAKLSYESGFLARIQATHQEFDRRLYLGGSSFLTSWNCYLLSIRLSHRGHI